MEKKDRAFLSIVIGIAVVILLLPMIMISSSNKKNQNNMDELKKYIIKNDSLIKEKDGQYSKLVNYFNTQYDLNKELKASNEELYKTIKKQDERILKLTYIVTTLVNKPSEGYGSNDSTDSALINLKLTYPEEVNPFITWQGSINKNNAYYKGMWSFGKLPLQIVLTEEKRGLWKTRVIGPEWFKVDSLMVNSLPPEQFTEKKDRSIQFLTGGGYIKSLSATGPDAISVGVGLNVFNKHNIIVNATTNKEVGVSYYYKFRTFKNR